MPVELPLTPFHGISDVSFQYESAFNRRHENFEECYTNHLYPSFHPGETSDSSDEGSAELGRRRTLGPDLEGEISDTDSNGTSSVSPDLDSNCPVAMVTDIRPWTWWPNK